MCSQQSTMRDGQTGSLMWAGTGTRLTVDLIEILLVNNVSFCSARNSVVILWAGVYCRNFNKRFTVHQPDYKNNILDTITINSNEWDQKMCQQYFGPEECTIDGKFGGWAGLRFIENVDGQRKLSTDGVSHWGAGGGPAIQWKQMPSGLPLIYSFVYLCLVLTHTKCITCKHCLI